MTVNLWNSYILLTPVWLVFIPQYFSSPSFMTISILVKKRDNCFVVHSLEPAVKQLEIYAAWG